MKRLSQGWMIGLALVLLALLIALPFGTKILREEGMEGVWKRKRENIERVAPDAAPLLDRIEETGRGAGAIR